MNSSNRKLRGSALPEDEHGSLTPLFLMVMVGVIGAMLAFMQLGHASVLSTESNTAADAAALAGAQELASQLGNLDAGVLTDPSVVLDHDRVCGAARAYASRNDATLTSCDIGLDPFQVTVTVRGDRGIVSGPLEDDPEDRPVSRARAEVGITFASTGGGTGGGWAPTSRDVSRDRLALEYEDLEPHELLEILIAEASRIDGLRLPYVWGGGHGMSPTQRNGPYDCSSAVSALLQTIYPAFPTITSGMYLGVGASGPSPSGHGLTIWAYPGHVFVTLGGNGWGTGSGHTPGAGWLTYDTPGTGYHSAARAFHVPALEPRNAEQVAAVQDAMARLHNGPGSAGSGWNGGADGAAMLPPDVRLVRVD